ncbi:hypothetical protein ACFX13_046204 [Malus domestica]
MKVERRDLPTYSRDVGWEKLKNSSTTCEGLPAAERFVIDMTYSNGKRNEAARSEHVALAMSRMACTIANKIAQCKRPFMPLMPKSVPRRPLRAKSGSHLEKLAIIKSNEMDSIAKVAPRPTSSATKTDSPAGKEEAACKCSCEKSTKPASKEADEICVLLKLDLLEVMDACAKYSKATKEVAKTMAAEAYSSTEEIKRLDSELIALKRSNISAPTQIQDFERVVFELHSVAYAKDEECIVAYNQVIHFKRIIDRFEPQVLELQGVLKINESLKKEVDELQRVYVGLLEENEQLKVGDIGVQAGAAGGEASDNVADKNVVVAEGVVVVECLSC